MNGLARAEWKVRLLIAVAGALVAWAMVTRASTQTVMVGGVALCIAIVFVDRSVRRDLGRGGR